MKIGYLTAWTPDEAGRARRLGFDCLEVHSASWGSDLVFTDQAGRGRILDDLKRTVDQGISISAIAHYGPGLHLKGSDLLQSFRNVIDVADACGSRIVATIAPRSDPARGIADNISEFAQVYSPVAAMAEEKGVRVAFENWPFFRGYPIKGGTMAFSPEAWRLMFEAVPSRALGLEFDPSHLYWQGIEPIGALKEFAGRVYHVHAKDTEIFADRRNRCGINGENWWTYRIPGLGDIDWSAFVGELHSLGYAGGICIEHEDDRFDGDRKEPGLEKYERGLRIGLATLRARVG